MVFFFVNGGVFLVFFWVPQTGSGSSGRSGRAAWRRHPQSKPRACHLRCCDRHCQCIPAIARPGTPTTDRICTRCTLPGSGEPCTIHAVTNSVDITDQHDGGCTDRPLPLTNRPTVTTDQPTDRRRRRTAQCLVTASQTHPVRSHSITQPTFRNMMLLHL